MMGIVRIAAVSYLNTIPFVYGLEHAEANLPVELLLDIPRRCVDNFASGAAEIALVPVGGLPSINDYKIITPYSISAEGCVKTVELLSDFPLQQIEKIYLDSHSRTSNELVKILCHNYWNIDPEWSIHEDALNVEPSQKGSAYLMIGDKVFEHADRFKYKYDLAEAWISYFGKPFVFAVWIARVGTPQSVIDAVEKMLSFGVSHISDAVKHYRGDKCYDENVKYLTENIKFGLDTDKRKSLEFFIRTITSPSKDGLPSG